MIFYFLILVFIIIKSSKYDPDNAIKTYMDKDMTNVIKGIFIIVVFFGHFSHYVTLDGHFDLPYIAIRNHLDQMVVSMFLFYSGFGVMESIKIKGINYIRHIPVNRALVVLLNFDIAVLAFAIARICMGNYFSIKELLLSLIAWESLGNSNWYIFVIIILYLLTFFAFIGFCMRETSEFNLLCGALTLLIFTILFVYSMIKMDMQWFWYDTAILYPMGALFSLCKEKIEKYIVLYPSLYRFLIACVVVIYYFSYVRRWDYGIEGYTIWALSFVAAVVLITMRFTITSNLFKWFGERLFSIYILQHLPMMILYHIGMIEKHTYFSFLIAIVITVYMAGIFEHITKIVKEKTIILFDTSIVNRG